MKVRIGYYLWTDEKGYKFSTWVFGKQEYPWAYLYGYRVTQYSILGFQIAWAVPRK